MVAAWILCPRDDLGVRDVIQHGFPWLSNEDSVSLVFNVEVPLQLRTPAVSLFRSGWRKSVGRTPGWSLAWRVPVRAPTGQFLAALTEKSSKSLPVVHRNSTCFMSMTFNLLLVFIVHLGIRSSKRSNARRTENYGHKSNFREWRFVYPDRSCVEHSSKPSTETSEEK